MKNRIYASFSVCLFILTVSTLFAACFSIQPTARKSPATMYETFFTESGTLYFIKPLELEGKDENLVIDFTFKNKPSDTDSAIVNFSVIGPQLMKNIELIFFKNSNKEVYSENTKLLFNEKKGNRYVSRFSAKISEPELKDLFSKADWKIEITVPGEKHVFSPKKGTQKAIAKLGNFVFFVD